MDQPPDTLGETGMANRLDDLVGFHLSEEELIIAYDLDDLQASAIYLYNLAKNQEHRPYLSDAQVKSTEIP